MTGGPRASLSTSKPVTATAAGLSLYRGRCVVSPQKGAGETTGSTEGEGFPLTIIFRTGTVRMLA